MSFNDLISSIGPVLPDNTSEALDIESTDAKEYITIDTSDGSEIVKIKAGSGPGLFFESARVRAGAGGQPGFQLEDASATNPTVLPNFQDDDTGIGWAEADALSLVAGGAEGIRVVKDASSSKIMVGINGAPEDENNPVLQLTGDGAEAELIIRRNTKDASNDEVAYLGYRAQSAFSIDAEGGIQFRNHGGSKRAEFDSSGNFTTLHTTTVQDSDLQVQTNSDDALAKSLVFTKSRNATDGNATIVDNNDVLGRIDWYAADASSGTTADNKTISASIYSQIDGTPGHAAMPGSIRMATTSDGASSVTDRFVIRQNGNIGLGDTEPNYRAVIGGSLSTPILYAYNSNTSELTNGITSSPNGAAGAIFDHRAANSIYCMNTTSTNAADGRSTGIAFFGRTDEASDEYPMQGALRVKHEGSAADQKGYMAFYTNAGTEDRAPTERMRIDSTGKVGIATNDPTEALDINSDAIRIRTAQSPASGGTGTAGMVCWDANYMYVCTATDTWKRVALTGGY